MRIQFRILRKYYENVVNKINRIEAILKQRI